MFSKIQKIILLCLLLIASFVWYAVFAESRDGLEVAILNVGQGDAIFIETPAGNQVLIDGGSGSKILSELGRMMPVYDKSIDLVVATHSDRDHIGGLVEVLKKYRIGTLVENGYPATTGVYKELESEITREHVSHEIVKSGDRIVLGDGVELSILGPTGEDFIPLPKKANEVMIVSRLTYGNTSFLFTGDVEKNDELRLARSGLDIKSNVLKVAHHGSRYSSAGEFLAAVKPRYSVISVGARNSYGHPHSDALERLKTVGTILFRTDTDGRILFESDGNSVIAK